MIPSVDNSTIHLYLGNRQERLRENKQIQDIERQELGLRPETSTAFKERQQQQQTVMSRLAVPFPRRVVERKAKHDVLDIRLANRARQGPLPVDEEVAEENDILAKQVLKLRQTGVHLLQGGGAINLNSSATFFGTTSVNESQPGFDSYHHQYQDNTFLTSTPSFGGINQSNHHQHESDANLTKSASIAGSTRNHERNNNNNNLYAGDVLFRPGRISQNLEPTDFWLYARQKVTQRTLGTQVLQHPVVVGQGDDADSLKKLLLQARFKNGFGVPAPESLN